MKNIALLMLGLLSCMTVFARPPQRDRATVLIQPDQEEGRINPHVYGFLLEHIYHSVSNGIWGENVWNRSFEELLAEGRWTADTDGHLTVDARDDRSGSHFDVARPRDGIVSLDFRCTSSEGSFLIGVRNQHRESLTTNDVWVQLDTRRQGRHVVVSHTGWIWHRPVSKLTTLPTASHDINGEAWNHLDVECRGARISVCLNGQVIFDQEIPDCPRDGAVTLGALGCEAVIKDISVKDDTGSDVPVNLNLSRHWEMVGDCLTAIDDIRPLNHAHSLLITNRGTWAGIEQKGRPWSNRLSV